MVHRSWFPLVKHMVWNCCDTRMTSKVKPLDCTTNLSSIKNLALMKENKQTSLCYILRRGMSCIYKNHTMPSITQVHRIMHYLKHTTRQSLMITGEETKQPHTCAKFLCTNLLKLLITGLSWHHSNHHLSSPGPDWCMTALRSGGGYHTLQEMQREGKQKRRCNILGNNKAEGARWKSYRLQPP